MNQERTHYHGRFNVRFQATRIVVMETDQHKLRSLHFSDVCKINWRIRDQLVELYSRMLAQNRPCEMIVSISDPLTRRQAELFNDSHESWALAAAAVGRLIFPSRSPRVRNTASVASGLSVRSVLGTRHAGDILINIQAWVSGGIGPQHSTISMLIEAQGGVLVR